MSGLDNQKPDNKGQNNKSQHTHDVAGIGKVGAMSDEKAHFNVTQKNNKRVWISLRKVNSHIRSFRPKLRVALFVRSR